MGIKKNHASITNEEGKIFIEPADVKIFYNKKYYFIKI